MAKLVDNTELIKRTEEEVNRWSHTKKLYYKERNTWTDEEKVRWRNARSNVYARMRAENKEKTKNFWLTQMNNGILNEFFKQCGLRICCGRVIFEDCGASILTDYLEQVVIPKLAEEMNIKGVKLKTKRISGMSQDLFDWERAEINNVENNN